MLPLREMVDVVCANQPTAPASRLVCELERDESERCVMVVVIYAVCATSHRQAEKSNKKDPTRPPCPYFVLASPTHPINA